MCNTNNNLFTDWSNIKYFDKSEFSQPEKMNEFHIESLDLFRHNIEKRVIVTSSFRDNDEGTHGNGLATDIMVPDWNGTLLELYLEAERHGFTGIGVYPHWSFKGKTIGGLHLDSRAPKMGRGARWIRIDVAGEQAYISLNQENIKRYLL